MRWRRLATGRWCWVGVVCAIAVAWWGWRRLQDWRVQQLVQTAQQAALAFQWDEARTHAEAALQIDSRHVDALMIAAEAARLSGRERDALTLLDRVHSDRDDLDLRARLMTATLAFQLGEWSLGEARLRTVLEARPDEVEANLRLAELLNLCGRTWEAKPFLLRVLPDHANVGVLAYLGNADGLAPDAAQVQAAHENSPADGLAALAAADLAITERRYDDARQLLATAGPPADPLRYFAERLTGELAAAADADIDFIKWNLQLPDECGRHPDVWSLRGRWLSARGRSATAIRCYYEALKLDPQQRGPASQAAALLQSRNAPSAAARLSEFSERLAGLSNVTAELIKHPNDVERIERASDVCWELRRVRESLAWAKLAIAVDPSAAWAHARLRTTGSSAADSNPTSDGLSIDDLWPEFSPDEYPLPDWRRMRQESRTAPRQMSSGGRIRWSDDAARVGIAFRYLNGAIPTAAGRRMFEFTGGGVAVVDYDRDGWPDLYWTQGGAGPESHASAPPSDALYRNRQGRTFQEATSFAILREDRFSQGAAAGDFDSDGFADLYVANAGLNRLWLNQGDGTYRDATADVGLQDERWTTSCAMADLDGDADPELIDVNYVTGDDVYRKVCRGARGESRVCQPTEFMAERPRIYWGSPAGRVAEDAGSLDGATANGLGLLIGDLDQSGGIDLFIASDMTANLFYADIESRRARGEHLLDDGIVRGLAFDQRGQPQACMGVAAADIDQNGTLDLFVTNFFREYNTLYRQHPDGAFVDESERTGLADPSFLRLGFGTQALDADVDGWPDLVVANGHIDDLTSMGDPYRMPPQFFRNEAGRFAELPAEQVGEWFAAPQLGRGLARLDWNRDGLDDFAVSDLEAPASLMTNRSSAAGFSVGLHLVGVEKSRDAIGAMVEATLQPQRRWRLLAGDGYQASNERRLTITALESAAFQHLQVRWPGGDAETLDDLVPGREYIVIQGHGAFELPRPSDRDGLP